MVQSVWDMRLAYKTNISALRTLRIFAAREEKCDTGFQPVRRAQVTNLCHTLAAANGRAAYTAVLIGVIAVGVCTGSARVRLIPADRNRISQDKPLVIDFGVAECCYRIDGERISIALADENISLIGKHGKKRLTGSIVLNGLPASRSRNYRLNRNSVRLKVSGGPNHARIASLNGIAAIWTDGDNHIHGRWRCSAKQQEFSILFGWGRDRPVLVLGEFAAVRRQGRTAELVARSEEDGMERSPRLEVSFQPSAMSASGSGGSWTVVR